MAISVDFYKKLGSFKMHVCFETQEDIMAILGMSGCGKSMTLKCIAGIEKPDSGRIVLNNRVLFDSNKKINLPPRERHVGYMFQDYALFPHMTVYENVAAGFREKLTKAEREVRILDMLQRFHILDLRDRYPGQLSGGQKQRTAMARMLAGDPELVMLDEPFSALDSCLKWELAREVKTVLKQTRKTCLFVSHSRDEVYRICDRVAVMDQGVMRSVMSVKTLFEDPGVRIAAVLSGCKNIAAVRKTGKYSVIAEDWGMEFKTFTEVPDDIAYIGIRAHYLQIAEKDSKERKKGENLIFPVHMDIEEEPFEWNASFQVKTGENISSRPMVWRVSKNLWQHTGKENLPECFYIPPRDIMLLRETGSN